MDIAEFRKVIANNPDCALRIRLSNGSFLADHFHVTEVGRVEKSFVDCGGVRRIEVRCVLQTLVAGDVNHRLSSTKLAKILSLTQGLNLPDDAPVEIEHQERSVSVDEVRSIEREGQSLLILLAAKQTACLAADACGIGPEDQLQVIDPSSAVSCCSKPGCCE